jgi:hypothetical protein
MLHPQEERMATSSAAIEEFSKVTGIARVTVEHTARMLREAVGGTELWPRSGKGGGKAARHVEPRHLANLILALAVTLPRNAPDAVDALGAAKPERRSSRASSAAGGPYALSGRALFTEAGGRVSGNRDLRTMLELLIRRVATDGTATVAGRRGRWTLWLNADAGTAQASWADKIGRERRERYLPQPQLLAAMEPSLPARVERLVKVPFGLIEVAADLWADTMAKRGPDRPPSPKAMAAGGGRPRRRRGGIVASAGNHDRPNPRRTGRRNTSPGR